MFEPLAITLKEANAFVDQHHSHHKPVHRAKWYIGAINDDKLVAVVLVGRPIAPALDDGQTLEVVRLCCVRGNKNAASFLLGCAERVAKAAGYSLLVSYVRADEDGTCYKAANWTPRAKVKGRPHNTGNRAGRWLPGLYEPSTEIVDRVRWERRLKMEAEK